MPPSELPVESPLTTWVRDSSRGFNDWIAARCSLPEDGDIDPIDSMSQSQRSTGPRSSLAVHVRSLPSTRTLSSTGSNVVPGLTRSTSAASSAASIDTDLASFLDATRLLEDDGDGNLVVPNTRRPDCDYTCIFHAIDCIETFECFEQWKTHCLSHFRGKPIPQQGRCSLCDFSTESVQPGAAWHRLLHHIAIRHFENGETLATSRPDFELYRHLFNHRIITFAQFKSLQMAPSPTRPNFVPPRAPSPPSVGFSNEPYVAQMNRRRDDREGRPRNTTRPRPGT